MPDKSRIFITRPVPDEILARLRDDCDIEMWRTSAISAPTAEKMPGLDGLMTYGHEPITDADGDRAESEGHLERRRRD